MAKQHVIHNLCVLTLVVLTTVQVQAAAVSTGLADNCRDTETTEYCRDHLQNGGSCMALFHVCRRSCGFCIRVVGSTWGAWTQWSSCSKTCGPGLRHRTRECNTAGAAGCEGDYDGDGTEKVLQDCNSGECPGWTEWSYPRACSVSCGVGTTRRTRECRGNTGDNSECQGDSAQMLRCKAPCVVPKPKIQKRTDCENPVPGVEWVYNGYDVTELDLLPWDHSGTSGPGTASGIRRKVVSVTCNNPGHRKYNEKEYEFSDQIHTVMGMPSGGCNSYSKQYNSSQEVANKFSLGVGLEANYAEYSFSASSTYKKMLKTVQKRDTFFSQISCNYLHLKVNLKRYLQLDPEAQTMVDEIHEPFNPRSYRSQPQWRLIEKYGTHYFREAILGGKYQMTYEIDSSFFKHNSEEELNVEMSAKVEFGLSGGNINANATKGNTNKTKTKLTEAKKYQQFFGGSANLRPQEGSESGSTSWQQSTYDYPWMVSGKVKPIYYLIHDRVKKLWVKQAVEQHVFRRFVENAEDLNVHNNPEVLNMINRFKNDHELLTLEKVECLRSLLFSKFRSSRCK